MWKNDRHKDKPAREVYDLWKAGERKSKEKAEGPAEESLLDLERE